jgi:hypothetical protein
VFGEGNKKAGEKLHPDMASDMCCRCNVGSKGLERVVKKCWDMGCMCVRSMKEFGTVEEVVDSIAAVSEGLCFGRSVVEVKV